MPADEELAATVDRVAIDHLQRCYADAVTARDWDEVAALFVPGASVSLDLVTRPPMELAAPDELVAFIAGALERFSFFQFVILNSRIDLWIDGRRDAATARIHMCELRQTHGETVRNDSYGRYTDRYRKVDGRWLIADRSYRSLARYPDGEVFPPD